MTTRYTHAIVRPPAPTLVRGLTTVVGAEPDVALALEQHRTYVATLEDLGLEIVALESLASFPDAYFVEDTAIIGDDFAVLARPGAEERRGEEDEIAPALERFRPVERITAPGTVDGGDVLEIGAEFLVGVSDRTNEEGAAQLGGYFESHGRAWSAVAVGSGLHLKSSVNALDEETLLVTAEYSDRPELARWRKVVVPAGEDYAANSLRVNDAVLVPAGYPGTREKLEALGFGTIVLEVSEARKMDGGLSCMSLRL